MNSSQLSN
jgi:hypothetical protein